MASFYFFTDIDLLSAQTAATQAFGPAGANVNISGTNYDLFQVTSLHTSTADANAYAICDGIAFIQPNAADSTLVNLVLKPTSQPPFAFPKVKFFIYRGIKKSSLIDSNGTDVAPSATNDLTKSIWDSQTAINNNAHTSNAAPKEALGIDITGSGFIEDVFFRTGVSYQLPVVKAGWNIGKFNSAGFGLDIMVESIGFAPTLDLVNGTAYANSIIIKVPSLSSSPSQPETFGHWNSKEAILNYIDPCAFYGSFYNSKFKTLDSSGSKSTEKKDSVYDDVLSKFYNKNVVYLDIRNEYNFSYNYFKNYGTTINAAFDGTSATTSIDYTIWANWPLFILSASDFPSGNTNSTNIIRVQMPDGSGDNTMPLMYISAGYLSSTYPKEAKQANKFISLIVTSGLTNEVSLTIPNRHGQSTVAPVSCYIKLKYNKQFDPNATTPPVSSGTVIRAANYLDHIFMPFGMRIPFPDTGVVKSYIYDIEQYVDARTALNMDFVARVGIAQDAGNCIFFAFPRYKNQNNDSFPRISLSMSGYKQQANEDFFNLLVTKFSGALTKGQLSLTPDTDYTETSETYIDFAASDDTGDSFTNQSVNDITAIGLLQTDFTAMNMLYQNSANFLPGYPVFLGTTKNETGQDNSGTTYSRATLVLRGYQQVSGVGNIQVNEVSTGIKIYTTDGTI